jgi:hypothetical protein
MKGTVHSPQNQFNGGAEMTKKGKKAVLRVLGGFIFALSLFLLVGPVLGTRASVGIIFMIVGLVLASKRYS